MAKKTLVLSAILACLAAPYCRQHLQQPVMEAVDKIVKESK